MIPFRTPFFLPVLYPTLTWRIPARDKHIYLTFDDGPVEKPTRFVLDILKSYSARATFFCIGDNVRKHSHVLEEVIADGHRIGNHTFNHLNGWREPNRRFFENIDRCDEILSQFLVHEHRRLFRPPYGKITYPQIRKVTPRYEVVMWDVLTKDYDRSSDPKFLLEKSLAATRPGSIVVFHDSLKALSNLEYMLPRYLEHFTREGYSFLSLP